MRRSLPILLALAIAPLLPTARPALGATAQPLEAGIRQIAERLAAELKDRHVKKLAVVDFSALSGYPSALNHVVAEELINQLHMAAPDTFTMVERRRLEQVRREQLQSSSKFFDQRTLADVGKVLGLDAIVSGSIADLEDSVKVYATAIAVETAEVFASSSARIQKDSSIDSLLHQSAMPSPSLVLDGPAATRHQVQAPDVFFQNRFIRLTPSSVSVTRNGKKATVALTLENLTTQDLHLALEEDKYCEFMLIDNSGKYSRHGSNRVTGITCIGPEAASAKPAEAFTMITSKSRTTILFNFHFLYPIEGDRLAFSADFLQRQEGKTSRFSAGLANLEFTRETDSER